MNINIYKKALAILALLAILQPSQVFGQTLGQDQSSELLTPEQETAQAAEPAGVQDALEARGAAAAQPPVLEREADPAVAPAPALPQDASPVRVPEQIPAPAPAVEELPSGLAYAEIQSAIEDYVREHQSTTAAMSVAVFNSRGNLYANSFGQADKERGIAADGETVFEWGSVTKLLVWVSAMQLVEQGRLDLQADVRDYLPEGFLGNLSYREPVTMLHLMNHQAGFQEMLVDLFVSDTRQLVDLGPALLAHPPTQIYAPGTVTAYSNWGVALAGYIVEQISGMPFHRYVRLNIFNPLGMAHTALAADLADNTWVREQRAKLQVYDTNGQSLPFNFFHIPLYPAGMATGTLADFATFARALLPGSPGNSLLFQNPDSLDQLFSPTSWYGETGIPINRHGFWDLQYGVTATGHGGNTAGCSSYLLLDLDAGFGVTVMTNQGGETVYNDEMMELFFGKYEDSALAGTTGQLPGGFFRQARTVTEGPLALYSALISPLNVSWSLFGPLDTFWNYNNVDGVDKIALPYTDLLRVGDVEAYIIIGLNALLLLGGLYAVLTLVFGAGLGSVIRLFKKNKKPRCPFNKWHYLACFLLVLLLVSIVLLALCISLNISSAYYVWLLVLNGVIAILMALYVLMLLIRIGWMNCRGRTKFKYFLTAIFMLAAIASVYYWNMYQYWAL